MIETLNPLWQDTSIEIDWIIFYETELIEISLVGIVKLLKDRDSKKIIFNNRINIYWLEISDFLVEFSDSYWRDIFINFLKSVKISNSDQLQIPCYSWNFEYNWKFFVIIWSQRKLNWITNEFLFKWMILDPIEFLKNNYKLWNIAKIKAKKLLSRLQNNSIWWFKRNPTSISDRLIETIQ